MATRKIKDAKDLSTNEFIFFKGHAKATFMSDGRSVEDAINNISTEGWKKELVEVVGDTIELLQPNKIYVVSPGEDADGVQILGIERPSGDYGEYSVISMPAPGEQRAISIFLPDDINYRWANGEIPELLSSDSFELSMLYVSGENGYCFNAVLTPFKSL